MLVDMNVPRSELVRLAHGMTPAKLAEVVAQLSRARDRLRLQQDARPQDARQSGACDQCQGRPAADGRRCRDRGRLRLRRDRDDHAGRAQCLVECRRLRGRRRGRTLGDAVPVLERGGRGAAGSAWPALPPTPRRSRSTAPRRAFIDGDDTPWSKAFLAAAYASRGIKMRCTSGAGSELLMGFHEKQVAALSRGALPLPAARHGRAGHAEWRHRRRAAHLHGPGGMRELMAENLIAVWLDLECASGNDARATESEIRVGAKILPFLIAGSDLICSGFGSILKYDNSFNASLLNGEELEDYLVLQRDFEADGGLTPRRGDPRPRAAHARRRGHHRRARGARPRASRRRT